MIFFLIVSSLDMQNVDCHFFLTINDDFFLIFSKLDMQNVDCKVTKNFHDRQAFESLEKKTKVQLEDPLLTRLYNILVKV